MTNVSARLTTAAACVSLALLAGCGSPSASDSVPKAVAGPGETHTMSDGTAMSDSEMKKMAPSGGHAHGQAAEDASAPGSITHRDGGPSRPAGMVCSLEIAQAIQRVLALRTVPTATDDWSHETYSCEYRLPTSTVRLTVNDVDDETLGRAYFDNLRRSLPGARPIRGLQNFGFPALETKGADGHVAFLKDHKTLWVDATKVAAGDLPPGFTRTGVAYGIASAVIACWTE